MINYQNQINIDFKRLKKGNFYIDWVYVEDGLNEETYHDKSELRQIIDGDDWVEMGYTSGFLVGVMTKEDYKSLTLDKPCGKYVWASDLPSEKELTESMNKNV